MEGACSEKDLSGKFLTPITGVTSVLSPGPSTPGPRIACTVTESEEKAGRTPLSLIRCTEDGCSAPEPLERSHVCYKPMTDREAKLKWSVRPKSVLVVKKWRDAAVTTFAFSLAEWLLSTRGLNVWMFCEEEPPVGVLRFDTTHTEEIDFIVTIGGDGTVLYTSSLFQGPCPPIIPVAHGSLGFLTAIEPSEVHCIIDCVLNGVKMPFDFTPRSRLCVTLYRGTASAPEATFLGLNELIVERGPSPYMTALDTYLDGEYLTVVQADGILCATPTGSTAYSLSAGGSILFPTVPALLFTPICPHTLSFRPVMFPDSSVITLQVPSTARASAWASVDGRCRTELKAGDRVTVQMSPFPVPLITKAGTHKDFIHAITSKLNWNMRERQLQFEYPTMDSTPTTTSTPTHMLMGVPSPKIPPSATTTTPTSVDTAVTTNGTTPSTLDTVNNGDCKDSEHETRGGKL